MAVKVMVLKNKSKEERFLACGMDNGDWEDPELDVSGEELKNAYMIWSTPEHPNLKENFQSAVKQGNEHKKNLIERFGDGAFVSLDFDEILKQYEPVEKVISESDFEHAKNLD